MARVRDVVVIGDRLLFFISLFKLYLFISKSFGDLSLIFKFWYLTYTFCGVVPGKLTAEEEAVSLTFEEAASRAFLNCIV